MSRWRICRYPNCHALIESPAIYCDNHKNSRAKKNRGSFKKAIPVKRESNNRYNKKRYSKENIKFTRFYKSKQWEMIRNIVIVKANGLCEECLKNGYVKPGKVVNHKIPLRLGRSGWEHRLDLNNLELLCPACHNRRTEWEKKHWHELMKKYNSDNSKGDKSNGNDQEI